MINKKKIIEKHKRNISSVNILCKSINRLTIAFNVAMLVILVLTIVLVLK